MEPDLYCGDCRHAYDREYADDGNTPTNDRECPECGSDNVTTLAVARERFWRENPRWDDVN